MLFAQLNTATSLDVDLPERADATPTFTVVSPNGGVLQTSTSVTMDAVDTTLSAPAAQGAQSLAVTSASGVTVGRRYLVGSAPEASGGEWVTVRAISGTTLTLVRPLRAARASGVGFQATRVTCAVGSSAVAVVGRHYRLEVTWLVGAAARPKVYANFDVTRYVPYSALFSLEDARELDPLVDKRMAAGTWWPALRDRVWLALLRRVAARVDPGSLVGVLDLTEAHAYLVRETVAETAGKDAADYRALMAQRFNEEFDAALGTAPIDNNGDGAISPNEGAPRAIQVIRG